MFKFLVVEKIFDMSILTSGGDSFAIKAKEPNTHYVVSACVPSTLQVLDSLKHKTG